MFQILVGSWASPGEHDFYANGNVLAWSQVLPFKSEFGELPDNFGIDWVSGVYGASTIAHVQGIQRFSPKAVQLSNVCFKVLGKYMNILET